MTFTLMQTHGSSNMFLDGTSNNKYDQILILIEIFLYKHGQREKHKNP